MATITAGSRAPSFTLPRDGGGKISLSDFKGRKLVLFFYPKADTPGCTREATEFSGLKAAFARAGTDVLGVSADPVPKQDKFKVKHSLTVPLASDETHAMLEAYGVWAEKSLVRPQVHGHPAQHLPDRAGRQGRPTLGEGEGRGPRRRGAGCGQSAVGQRAGPQAHAPCTLH